MFNRGGDTGSGRWEIGGEKCGKWEIGGKKLCGRLGVNICGRWELGVYICERWEIGTPVSPPRYSWLVCNISLFEWIFTKHLTCMLCYYVHIYTGRYFTIPHFHPHLYYLY